MSFPAVDPTGRREVVGGMEVDDEPSEIRGLSRPTPGSPRVGSVYSDTGAFTTTPGAYEPESKRTRASRADSLRAARRDRPSSTSSGRLGDPLLGGPRTSRAPSTWSERGRQTWRSRASTIASQIFMGLAALDPRKDGSIHKESLGEAESYDTLDYDRCENQVYMEAEKMLPKAFMVRYDLWKWILTLIIGVITGTIAGTIDIAIDTIAGPKFTVLVDSINGCMESGCLARSFLLYWLMNLGLVTVAALLTTLSPVAAGSGIPEIKCYLNGIKIPKVHRLLTLVSKAVGVVFSVAGGMPVGKEGPMIHSGSIVGAGVSQGKSSTLPWIDFRYFQMYQNDRDKRDYVSSGAAAGVAAAFGAPIGGVLFSLEEGSSFWSQSLTWRSFFCAVVSTFTLNLWLSGYELTWGALASPALIEFGAFNNLTTLWRPIDLLFFGIMAFFGGALGAFFNFINLKISIWRRDYLLNRSQVWRVVEAMLISTVVTAGGFALAFSYGNCIPSTNVSNSTNTRNLFCQDGYYNDMATLAFNSEEEAIKQLYHNDGEFSWATLALFLIYFFLISCWTYGAGIPSGLFVPCLLTGAIAGRLFGSLLKTAFPSIMGGVFTGSYSLVGSAAFIGGVVRMTISLTVILIETTNNIAYGLPLMVTMMISKWIGDLFNEGLYDIHIELKKIPLLEWEPPQQMRNFYAAHVMAAEPVCLEEVVQVSDVLRVLETSTHSCFPIVDRRHKLFVSQSKKKDYVPPNRALSSHGNSASASSSDSSVPYNLAGVQRGCGTFCGTILRHQLVTLLLNQSWGRRYGSTVDAPMLSYYDFMSYYPRYPTSDMVFVGEQDKNLFMDLSPYMNPCPYTIQEMSPLPRVFDLFRTMGLRHLPVVDRFHQVLGVITRKDLVHLEYHFAEDSTDPARRRNQTRASRGDGPSGGGGGGAAAGGAGGGANAGAGAGYAKYGATSTSSDVGAGVNNDPPRTDSGSRGGPRDATVDMDDDDERLGDGTVAVSGLLNYQTTVSNSTQGRHLQREMGDRPSFSQ